MRLLIAIILNMKVKEIKTKLSIKECLNMIRPYLSDIIIIKLKNGNFIQAIQ